MKRLRELWCGVWGGHVRRRYDFLTDTYSCRCRLFSIRGRDIRGWSR